MDKTFLWGLSHLSTPFLAAITQQTSVLLFSLIEDRSQVPAYWILWTLSQRLIFSCTHSLMKLPWYVQYSSVKWPHLFPPSVTHLPSHLHLVKCSNRNSETPVACSLASCSAPEFPHPCFYLIGPSSALPPSFYSPLWALYELDDLSIFSSLFCRYSECISIWLYELWTKIYTSTHGILFVWLVWFGLVWFGFLCLPKSLSFLFSLQNCN